MAASAACSALLGPPGSPWSRQNACQARRTAALAAPPRLRAAALGRSKSGSGDASPSSTTAAEAQVATQPQQPSSDAAPAASTPAASAAPLVAAAAVLLLAGAGPALALDIRTEPSNALSLPTWAVHTSSVLEWVTAMGLMWRYGEVSGNPRWKGMAWGMMPCLGSAMCACTWHFFYNSPDLQFLVSLQAFLTVVGNFTCWWAAYRIYQWAQEQQQGA